MNHISVWLRNIYFNGKTGLLVLTSGDISKNFFFQKGRLIHVKTNQAEERLGNILWKLGKISREKQEMLGRDLQPNRSLGEVLVESGVITRNDLEKALQWQMREAMIHAFSLFHADFIFHPHEISSVEMKESGVEIPRVIESGIRDMPCDESLPAFLAGKVFSVKNRDMVHLLPERDVKLLDRFNGKDASDTVRAACGLEPDEFWRTLLIFYCLDIVDIQKSASFSAAADSAVSPGEELGDMPARPADLLAFRNKISTMNFYRILGVSHKAADAEIKKSYFHLARKYHPDSYGPDLSAESRGHLDDIFQMITTAYKTLIMRESRRAYDAKMNSTGFGTEDVQDNQKRAEIKFRQGKTLYNQTRYEEAAILLEEAVRLKKDKGDYFLLLALAQTRLPGKSRKAEENFLKAIALEPWNPEGYVGLGYLYKSEDMTIKALRQFLKAVELDPDHRTAVHEAELLGGVGKKKKIFGMTLPDLFKSSKK